MNWPHVHLMLNHIPVFGFVFVFLFYLTALVLKKTDLKKICVWAFVIVAVLAVPIKYTGEFAFESLMMEEGFNHDLISRHEKAADQATTAAFVLGLFAAMVLFLGRKDRHAPAWSTLTLLALALVTMVMMFRTANFGGHIRHPEIRPADLDLESLEGSGPKEH